MLTTVLFLIVYGLYCFFVVNRAKSVPWLVANVVVLAAGAVLVWWKQDLYFLCGLLAAAGYVCYQAVAVKTPLVSGWKTYLKLVVENTLFFPVQVFELAYKYLSPKL